MIRKFNGTVALNAGTAARIETLHTAGSTFYVTKITLTIITHAAGKFVHVQDDNSSPKVIASHTDAAAAAGVPSTVTWDFGYGGIPLTAAKNLECISEVGGPAGYVYAEGHEVTA